jgi:hypothetical protein
MTLIRRLSAAALALTLAIPAASAAQAHLVFPNRTTGGVPYLYRRSYGTASDSIDNRVPASGDRCKRGRSLLALFSPDALVCGEGWTFPGLIDGDCPIAVCTLKARDRGASPFGSTNK